MKKLFMVVLFVLFMTGNLFAAFPVELKEVVHFNPQTNTSDVFIIPYIKNHEGTILVGDFKFDGNVVTSAMSAMDFINPEKGKLFYYSITDQKNGCYTCRFNITIDSSTYGIGKNVKLFDKTNIEEENTVLFDYDEMIFKAYNVEINYMGYVKPFKFKLKLIDFGTQEWMMFDIIRSASVVKLPGGQLTQTKKVYSLNKNGYGEYEKGKLSGLDTLIFKNVMTCIKGKEFRMNCVFEKTGFLWTLKDVEIY